MPALAVIAAIEQSAHPVPSGPAIPTRPRRTTAARSHWRCPRPATVPPLTSRSATGVLARRAPQAKRP